MADKSFVKDEAGIVEMLTSTVAPAVQQAAQIGADKMRGMGFEAEVEPAGGKDRCGFKYGLTLDVRPKSRADWHTVNHRHEPRGLEKLRRLQEAAKETL